MEIGICRLCLVEGAELQETHFLPKGVFRILRDDDLPKPDPWHLTPEKEFQSSKQLKAPLLCRACENERLSKKGENWVLAHCLRKQGFRLATILAARKPDVFSFANPTKLYYAAGIPEIDCSALSYFAASMFWRGSIHPWNEDGTVPVKLGPFQESFRKYLMDEAAFPNDCALLVSVREGKEIDRLAYCPTGQRKGSIHTYKFPMPGLAFSLVVSKNIPPNFRQCCFVHNAVHPIMVTTLFEKWLVEDAVRMRSR